MIEKLTAEQEKILITNRDFFIKSALTFKPLDQKKCDAFIDWVYSLASIEPPQKVYVSSPYAAQVKANELAGTVGQHYLPSTYTSIWYQSWYSYYKTMQDIGVVLLGDFNKLLEVNNLGIYECIEFDKACIISERPVKVIRNNANFLHNPNGPAIEWNDGFKLYFINGRCLPSWIWEKAVKNEITKEDFLKEKNSEIRGGIYAVMGQKKVTSLLNTKVMDTKTIEHEYGVETVQLIKTEDKYPEIGNVPFCWVKVTCPTTSTEYMLGVEPSHTNALEALASTSPFKAADYKLSKAS